MGCTGCANHEIAMQITATRFTRDAMLYVTGLVLARIINTIAFWAKWTVPLAKKAHASEEPWPCPQWDGWPAGASAPAQRAGRSVQSQMGIIRTKAMVDE
jgi:hypothetical protein